MGPAGIYNLKSCLGLHTGVAGLHPDPETVTLVSSGDKAAIPHEGLAELSVCVGSLLHGHWCQDPVWVNVLGGVAGIKRHSQEEHLYLKFLPSFSSSNESVPTSS